MWCEEGFWFDTQSSSWFSDDNTTTVHCVNSVSHCYGNVRGLGFTPFRWCSGRSGDLLDLFAFSFMDLETVTLRISFRYLTFLSDSLCQPNVLTPRRNLNKQNTLFLCRKAHYVWECRESSPSIFMTIGHWSLTNHRTNQLTNFYWTYSRSIKASTKCPLTLIWNTQIQHS